MRKGEFVKVYHGVKCPINKQGQIGRIVNIEFEGECHVQVAKLIKSKITQNQFNTLVSLAYNIGVGAFGRSTLLRKVNANPNDPTIGAEFLKWVNAGGSSCRA